MSLHAKLGRHWREQFRSTYRREKLPTDEALKEAMRAALRESRDEYPTLEQLPQSAHAGRLVLAAAAFASGELSVVRDILISADPPSLPRVHFAVLCLRDLLPLPEDWDPSSLSGRKRIGEWFEANEARLVWSGDADCYVLNDLPEGH